MLLQFTVSNYLSFDAPTTFSLLATSNKDHPRHVIAGKPPALRGAALYGANAAGKSNLILAMGFARDFIVSGTRGKAPIAGLRPFLLSDGTPRPARFEWVFRHEGKVWSYGLVLETRRVVEEYLFARSENGGQEKKWFERTTDEAGKVSVTFGEELRGAAKSENAQFLKFVAKGTREAQPFLTEAQERNVEKLAPVFEWFDDVLTIVRAESQFAPLLSVARTDTDFLNYLSDFLRHVDTGIEKIVVHEKPLDWQRDLTEVPTNVRETWQAALAKETSNTELLVTGMDIGTGTRKLWAISRLEDGTDQLRTLQAFHRARDGKEHKFDLESESEGTQRLIHIIPLLFRFHHEPTVLVIDELDRRLHTLLTRRFVQMALDCEPESLNQLIFTTHDTNLLDRELLRRDEIWFVEKDAGGASHLSSLAEFKVRGDLVYEKGYLNGRFGAIPYFGSLKSLDCEVLEAP